MVRLLHGDIKEGLRLRFAICSDACGYASTRSMKALWRRLSQHSTPSRSTQQATICVD